FRKDREKDFRALRSIVDTRKVERIVIGMPIRMDGTPGRQARRVEKFAQELRDRLGLPVETWDERLTTVEAERILREDPRKRARKKGLADRLAAVFILQGYMDRDERPARPADEI
ncbi:MAG: Holliday junction resolvase RuvX, partial [Acidobacteriota bacterium]